MTTVINAFEMMKDMSLVVDVIGTSFAQGYGIDVLSAENMNAVLYQCRKLLESKVSEHKSVGLQTVNHIVHYHCD